jgi:hypothetical protein
MIMAIKIRRIGDLYEADVTPPHGSGVSWSTARPVLRDELVKTLLEHGCHQTDIGDAFYEADPEWLMREQS